MTSASSRWSPTRSTSTKLVATAADRGKLAKVIEQRARIDGGRPHDVERIAVAPVFGIEPCQDFQRPDLGVVAAPNGGERFQLGNDILALEIAERVAQRRLAQPSLRRSRTVPGIRRRTVGGERLFAVAQPFRQSPDEHRE